jgi:hypothetical protein
VLLAGVLTLTAGSAAFGNDPHDIPLKFDVTTTPTTPTASTGSVRGPGSGGTGAGVGSGGDTSAAEAVGAVPISSVSPTAGTETVGGVLAIGGLSTSYAPARNPLAGTVHVQMTVQNLSTEVIEPTVAFWLTNGLGMKLSQRDGESLGAIAPGELRIAEADLTHVGQWAAVDVHMSLTPPAEIDGVALEPLVRDRWFFAPPWFVVAALALGAAALAAWRWSARTPAALVALAAS